MPRPASDRAAIETEIVRVRSLGLDALRTLWCVTFRSSPPPAFTKDLMARFLCWHFQEQARGGLDPETAKHLDDLARGGKPGADRPRRLKPGTVLLRGRSAKGAGAMDHNDFRGTIVELCRIRPAGHCVGDLP
jgi:hypothetical protein